MKALAIALLVACSVPALTAQPVVQVPVRASFYGEEYRGRPMADRGIAFDPDGLTCASWIYPFGTVLRVACGNRFILVTVTDRGPARYLVRRGIKVDLSAHAFSLISPDRRHPLRPGIILVTVTQIEP